MFHPEGYHVFEKRELEQWRRVEVTSESHSYRVEALDCGQRYQFYLTAFNLLGTSPPSNILHVRTLGQGKINIIGKINLRLILIKIKVRLTSSYQFYLTAFNLLGTSPPPPTSSMSGLLGKVRFFLQSLLTRNSMF